MHHEYWGECSSATLWQPVGVRGDKKENKLIQMSCKYDITNTNGSYKCLIQMYKKAWCTCKVVGLIAILLTSPSSLLFKSSLFSRALRMKTKSSAKPGTECGALSARPLTPLLWSATNQHSILFYAFFNESPTSCFFSYHKCSTRVKWVVKCIHNYPVTREIRNSVKFRHVEFAR